MGKPETAHGGKGQAEDYGLNLTNFPYHRKPMVYDPHFEAWYQGMVVDADEHRVHITFPGWESQGYNSWMPKNSDRFDYCTGGKAKWKPIKGIKGAWVRISPSWVPKGEALKEPLVKVNCKGGYSARTEATETGMMPEDSDSDSDGHAPDPRRATSRANGQAASRHASPEPSALAVQLRGSAAPESASPSGGRTPASSSTAPSMPSTGSAGRAAANGASPRDSASGRFVRGSTPAPGGPSSSGTLPAGRLSREVRQLLQQQEQEPASTRLTREAAAADAAMPPPPLPPKAAKSPREPRSSLLGNGPAPGAADEAAAHTPGSASAAAASRPQQPAQSQSVAKIPRELRGLLGPNDRWTGAGGSPLLAPGTAQEATTVGAQAEGAQPRMQRESRKPTSNEDQRSHAAGPSGLAAAESSLTAAPPQHGARPPGQTNGLVNLGQKTVNALLGGQKGGRPAPAASASLPAASPALSSGAAPPAATLRQQADDASGSASMPTPRMSRELRGLLSGANGIPLESEQQPPAEAAAALAKPAASKPAAAKPAGPPAPSVSAARSTRQGAGPRPPLAEQPSQQQPGQQADHQASASNFFDDDHDDHDDLVVAAAPKAKRSRADKGADSDTESASHAAKRAAAGDTLPGPRTLVVSSKPAAEDGPVAGAQPMPVDEATPGELDAEDAGTAAMDGVEGPVVQPSVRPPASEPSKLIGSGSGRAVAEGQQAGACRMEEDNDENAQPAADSEEPGGGKGGKQAGVQEEEAAACLLMVKAHAQQAAAGATVQRSPPSSPGALGSKRRKVGVPIRVNPSAEGFAQPHANAGQPNAPQASWAIDVSKCSNGIVAPGKALIQDLVSAACTQQAAGSGSAGQTPAKGLPPQQLLQHAGQPSTAARPIAVRSPPGGGSFALPPSAGRTQGGIDGNGFPVYAWGAQSTRSGWAHLPAADVPAVLLQRLDAQTQMLRDREARLLRLATTSSNQASTIKTLQALLRKEKQERAKLAREAEQHEAELAGVNKKLAAAEKAKANLAKAAAAEKAKRSGAAAEEARASRQGVDELNAVLSRVLAVSLKHRSVVQNALQEVQALCKSVRAMVAARAAVGKDAAPPPGGKGQLVEMHALLQDVEEQAGTLYTVLQLIRTQLGLLRRQHPQLYAQLQQHLPLEVLEGQEYLGNVAKLLELPPTLQHLPLAPNSHAALLAFLDAAKDINQLHAGVQELSRLAMKHDVAAELSDPDIASVFLPNPQQGDVGMMTLERDAYVELPKGTVLVVPKQLQPTTVSNGGAAAAPGGVLQHTPPTRAGGSGGASTSGGGSGARGGASAAAGQAAPGMRKTAAAAAAPPQPQLQQQLQQHAHQMQQQLQQQQAAAPQRVAAVMVPAPTNVYHQVQSHGMALKLLVPQTTAAAANAVTRGISFAPGVAPGGVLAVPQGTPGIMRQVASAAVAAPQGFQAPAFQAPAGHNIKRQLQMLSTQAQALLTKGAQATQVGVTYQRTPEGGMQALLTAIPAAAQVGQAPGLQQHPGLVLQPPAAPMPGLQLHRPVAQRPVMVDLTESSPARDPPSMLEAPKVAPAAAAAGPPVPVPARSSPAPDATAAAIDAAAAAMATAAPAAPAASAAAAAPSVPVAAPSSSAAAVAPGAAPQTALEAPSEAAPQAAPEAIPPATATAPQPAAALAPAAAEPQQPEPEGATDMQE